MPEFSRSETEQLDRANASPQTPVVFIHGLWLLPSSWDRWAELFRSAGYVTLQPGWPDDPETVAEANANPEVFAHKSVKQVVDHMDAFIHKLKKKPAVVGHSFGGLFTQMLAGRGSSAVSVSIDGAPYRGIRKLPVSSLKAAAPVLMNPLNRRRAVALTFAQFRFAFANAVSEDEAKELHTTYAVPGSGVPLFQAAAANVDPWTELKVKTKAKDRGPMLIISGQNDNTVPDVISRKAFELQSRNAAVTEYAEMSGRGHSLPIDSGWQEVAEAALNFVKRFT
ncbi:MAG: alpha/beta hydrolase [Acidimicrobiales bacterium]